MSRKNFSWIPRQQTDDLHTRIVARPKGVQVFVISAPAGLGKTFMARDLGTRFGSRDGYLAACDDQFCWSGLLDLYDPDMTSNKRIEQTLIDAFQSPSKNEFSEYRREREIYERMSNGGILGANIEDQRINCQKAFARGLNKVSETRYPVIAFDTVERLQSALDPTELELGTSLSETSNILGWLLFQISVLPQGTILLFGRNTEKLAADVDEAAREKNHERRNLGPIEVFSIKLDVLNQKECDRFFARRKEMYPGLEKNLDQDLQKLMISQVETNPLVLDIALQTLLETGDPHAMREMLGKEGGVKEVEYALLHEYIKQGKAERQLLMELLFIARNGLFDDLLKHLQPGSYADLLVALDDLAKLPFVKMRELSYGIPEMDGQRPSHRTYFLHDKMFSIMDEMGLIPRPVVQKSSQKIADWYEEKIEEIQIDLNVPPEGRRRDEIADLLVESLYYRMRADPEAGYNWYLEQTDRAVRGSEIGLDTRLRDSLSQFIASAFPRKELLDLPTSIIDQEITKIQMPALMKDFRLDSATLWVRRYSQRGKHDQAKFVATNASWVKEIYEARPARYRFRYAEFLLWWGQSVMYGHDPREAVLIYNQVVELLTKKYPVERMEKAYAAAKPFTREQKQACLVLGRTCNNMGYIYWMYLGQYWYANYQFQQATRYFKLTGPVEELANSNDNMGRVYAILGNVAPALEYIQEAFNLRAKAGLDYRRALSEVSLALVYARFENVQLAIASIAHALDTFRGVGLDRGIGLAQIARGYVFRCSAESWRDMNHSIDVGLEEINTALSALSEAIRTFQYVVQEPIRLVQALNEYGCCQRTRYWLLRAKQETTSIRLSSEMETAFQEASRYYKDAIDLAYRNGYQIDWLDSLQDMAVLLIRAGKLSESEEILSQVEKNVPKEYKFNRSRALPELDDSVRVDAYFKIMGQVELLRGAIQFERYRSMGTANAQAEETVLTQVMEHYMLAIAYFNCFSGGSYTHRQTFARMYKRFKNCRPEFIHKLRLEHVPAWIKRYKMEGVQVIESLDELFEVLSPDLRKKLKGGFDPHVHYPKR